MALVADEAICSLLTSPETDLQFGDLFRNKTSPYTLFLVVRPLCNVIRLGQIKKSLISVNYRSVIIAVCIL